MLWSVNIFAKRYIFCYVFVHMILKSLAQQMNISPGRVEKYICWQGMTGLHEALVVLSLSIWMQQECIATLYPLAYKYAVAGWTCPISRQMTAPYCKTTCSHRFFHHCLEFTCTKYNKKWCYSSVWESNMTATLPSKLASSVFWQRPRGSNMFEGFECAQAVMHIPVLADQLSQLLSLAYSQNLMRFRILALPQSLSPPLKACVSLAALAPLAPLLVWALWVALVLLVLWVPWVLWVPLEPWEALERWVVWLSALLHEFCRTQPAPGMVPCHHQTGHSTWHQAASKHPEQAAPVHQLHAPQCFISMRFRVT